MDIASHVSKSTEPQPSLIYIQCLNRRLVNVNYNTGVRGTLLIPASVLALPSSAIRADVQS